MAQLLKSVEPTIWALRKNAKKKEDGISTLYEHLYGYDPIRVIVNPETDEPEQAIRKGSAENPHLNIINPETNFTVMELASEDTNG